MTNPENIKDPFLELNDTANKRRLEIDRLETKNTELIKILIEIGILIEPLFRSSKSSQSESEET